MVEDTKQRQTYHSWEDQSGNKVLPLGEIDIFAGDYGLTQRLADLGLLSSISSKKGEILMIPSKILAGSIITGEVTCIAPTKTSDHKPDWLNVVPVFEITTHVAEELVKLEKLVSAAVKFSRRSRRKTRTGRSK